MVNVVSWDLLVSRLRSLWYNTITNSNSSRITYAHTSGIERVDLYYDNFHTKDPFTAQNLVNLLSETLSTVSGLPSPESVGSNFEYSYNEAWIGDPVPPPPPPSSPPPPTSPPPPSSPPPRSPPPMSSSNNQSLTPVQSTSVQQQAASPFFFPSVVTNNSESCSWPQHHDCAGGLRPEFYGLLIGLVFGLLAGIVLLILHVKRRKSQKNVHRAVST